MLKNWEDLPDFMRVPEVRPYWEVLNKKRGQLFLKRCFDLFVSIILLIILALPMLLISICIKLDSDGPVFYRQERVTTYGKHKRIVKEIFQVFHSICMKNNLTYYFGFGSLLGAIRDDDLIPWDADIDVLVKISDAKKIIEILVKELPEDLYVISNFTNSNYYLCC